MPGWKDTKSNIKKYLKFDFRESRGILLTIFIYGFILSYKYWGPGDEFSLSYGLINLVLAIGVAFLILMIDLLGHSIVGMKYGFKPEYRVLVSGLLFSLVLIFISRGNLIFLLPGGVFLHTLKRSRLGYFRYGTDKRHIGYVTMAGPLAVVLFVMALENLNVWFGVNIDKIIINGFPILNQIILFGWIFAVCSLLPFPKMDGFDIFYDSRLTYVFMAGSVVGYFVLRFAFGIYSLIGALAIGTICWAVYLLAFENKVLK